ncbi:MAG TPA: RnfABCDGE type electron transport complex subunit D [Gemmatimonadales bacterium]|nr:RnfABCDGE type electron transport complex subunit D [Gemmatimonadales bacterium]
MSRPAFLITASPHLSSGDSTPTIMWNVVGSLVPVTGTAIYFFGPSAFFVIAAATLGALLTERAFGKPGTLRDGSAMITGILLGLTLPPGLPMWMAFVGGAFSIGFGKLIFGGLGQNIFNPALLGRAFLQAAFPVSLTTWPVRGDSWWALAGDTFALPFRSPSVDAATGATPLGLMKFEQQGTPLADLFLGTTGGSLGETSSLVILVCGAYLAARNYLNWRIPIAIFVTVAAFAAALQLVPNSRVPDPAFMLFSGGLMLGAVFMATDMVTSPVTNLGCWVFGAGIGILVVVIRLWGGLAEGVMYAILIMNALVPFINRATQPRVFGTGKAVP